MLESENQTKVTNFLQQSTQVCCKKTNFNEVFLKAYEELGKYGDKNRMLLNVLDLIIPAENLKIGTLRTYCPNLDRIPTKSKAFFYKAFVTEIERILLQEYVNVYEDNAMRLRQLLDELNTSLLNELKILKCNDTKQQQ